MNTTTVWPISTITEHIPEDLVLSQRHLHICVNYCTIHNTQELEPAYVLIS